MSTNPNALPKPPVDAGGRIWARLPVKTHLLHIKEDLGPVLDEYVRPQLQPGDWIALSEKFVTISQGRVVHRSTVRAGVLAKLLVMGVKKHPNDVGFSDPRKMQVAIMQAGWFRMLFAMIAGGVSKFVLRRHGDFWRIAGHRISEIDGFNPSTVKPFDEFAMLGPEDPPRDAQQIADMLGAPVVIVDANNINVEVLGMSRDAPVSKADARLVLLDNPMGQNDELTPIIIVRPIP